MATVPYASAIGSLMYAMVCTRPDITHAVGVVSRFLSNPGKEHWNAVKWILKYLRGTSKMSLCFGSGKSELVGFTDADMAGNIDTRKSTSRYLITFSWGSCLVAIKATKMCCFINYRSRVYCSYGSVQRYFVVEEIPTGIRSCTTRVCSAL